MNNKSHQPSALIQFGVNFVVPIVILTRFSGEEQLGATKGLLLALAFPVVFELYNIYKRKKLSMMSVVAIGGILVTGALSLLGLSEGWLAIRRSMPYLIMSVVVLVSIIMKRSLLLVLLKQILDMDTVGVTARKKRVSAALAQRVQQAGIALIVSLIAMALASYVLTRVVIVSELGTSGFNEEYARLRLLSLPAITLPFIVVFSGIIFFLARSIEKLTGLDLDTIAKKK